jgi:hypothetical protein
VSRKREPGEWRTLDALWVVRDDRALSEAQWRVLVALIMHAGEDGRAHPGIRRLAEVARCSRSTVHAALAALEAGVGPIAVSINRGRVTTYGDAETHEYVLGIREGGGPAQTPPLQVSKPGGGPVEDPRVAHQETHRWSGTGPTGGPAQGTKEDSEEDGGEDREEDTGALTHADESIQPVEHHGMGIDVTSTFFATDAPTKRVRKARPDAVARALDEATRRVRADDWSGCTPTTLVGLYAYLHRGVYNVAPDELADDWLPALSSARRCLEKDFGGDAAKALEFVRWSWQRERRSRRKNPDSDFRMGWRYQFSRRLLTDYRVALVAVGQ